MILIPLCTLLFLKQYFYYACLFQQSHFANCRRSCRNVSRRIIFTDECDLNHQCRLSGTKKVLVQELNCIDALARVDVLCLDKTGTITEGQMTVEKVIPFTSEEEMTEITQNLLAHLPDKNPTAMALRDFFPEKETYAMQHVVPFSSETKIQLCFF